MKTSICLSCKGEMGEWSEDGTTFLICQECLGNEENEYTSESYQQDGIEVLTREELDEIPW